MITTAPDVAALIDEARMEWFAACGYLEAPEGTALAFAHQHPGGRFEADTVECGDAPERLAHGLPRGSDCWMSVNVMRGGLASGKKGGEADVAAVIAVAADLDVKPGVLADLDAARAVVATLSALLRAQPATVVMSGHGLQPRWRVDDGGDVDRARGLSRAFGRLVAEVVGAHGGKVDTISNVDRILRIPGTWNMKAEPVQVRVEVVEADPDILTLDDLEGVLLDAGVRVEDEDATPLAEAVVAPDEWPDDVDTTACRYVGQMIDGWAADAPEARHPWLVGQAVRLACARRAGCIGGEQVALAEKALRHRFARLLEHTGVRRAPGVAEVEAALAWGVMKAASKTDDAVAHELGEHTHGPTAEDQEFMDDIAAGEAPPAGDTGDERPRRARLRMQRADTIVMRAVDWLLLNVIPLGALTLLAGSEGVGKSTRAYKVVADVTRGRLPGDLEGKPRAVIIVATEDSWATTVVPRLAAHDADLSLVHRVEPTVEIDDDAATLSLPAHVGLLAEAIADESAALVLLDPLMSRIGTSLDTHVDAEVRQALEPLVAMADATGCALLGIIHVNKGASTSLLDKVMGSKAFTAVARAVLFVIRDPEDVTPDEDDVDAVLTPPKRLFGIAKSNVGRDDIPAERFHIEQVTVGVDPVSGKRLETGAVVVDGNAAGSIRAAAARVAAADSGQRQGSQADRATAWLAEWLTTAGHPMRVSYVEEQAKHHKFGAKALRTARERLRVRTDQAADGWWISLPGTSAAARARGESP